MTIKQTFETLNQTKMRDIHDGSTKKKHTEIAQSPSCTHNTYTKVYNEADLGKHTIKQTNFT